MSFLTKNFPNAPLYYLMAKEIIPDPSLWDDCVQEAIIAVWRTQEKRPGKDRTYYNAVARKTIYRTGTTQLFTDSPPSLCGKWMPRKKESCGRRENHPGGCTSKEALGKDSDTCRRTNASHDVLRRSHESYDQIFHGWQDDSANRER